MQHGQEFKAGAPQGAGFVFLLRAPSKKKRIDRWAGFVDVAARVFGM